MAVYLLDSVKVATPTTGTGSVTVGAAEPGYLTPAEAGAVDGRVYTWRLDDGDDFEIFIGTYSSTGPTVSRDTVLVSKIGGTAGTSKISLSGSATLSSVPVAALFRGTRRVGEFFWYFGEDPPPYALVCDGSTISRTTYADLWAFAQTSGNLAASEGVKQAGQFGPGNGTTTFTLPDLTTGAEFIRAVTIGRGIGTWQNGALQSHTHTLPGQVMLGQQLSSGLNSGVAGGDPYSKVGLVNDSTPGAPNVGATGGTETRPRNIALLPCIVF
jgi:microcystin-dependent protein